MTIEDFWDTIVFVC